MVMVLIGLSVFIVCSYVFCVPQVSIYSIDLSRHGVYITSIPHTSNLCGEDYNEVPNHRI